MKFKCIYVVYFVHHSSSHRLSLFCCSEGLNGSIGLVQDCGLVSSSMSSLTSKTSSLSLSSEQVASSPDLPKNGVAHS